MTIHSSQSRSSFGALTSHHPLLDLMLSRVPMIGLGVHGQLRARLPTGPFRLGTKFALRIGPRFQSSSNPKIRHFISSGRAETTGFPFRLVEPASTLTRRLRKKGASGSNS